jgi:TatD DNase family protein
VRKLFFDTHCHLTLFPDIPSTIDKARNSSVKKILAVSMYFKDNWEVIKLAKQYQEVIPALGLHPVQAASVQDCDAKLEIIKNLILDNEITVIGEIGLDRYFVKEAAGWKQQEKVLKFFIELALKNNLTINLHAKYAETELIELLAEYDLKNVVIHWFAGSPALVQRGINQGYYFSVTPEVFYSTRMQKLVELVPLNQLLTESDGPVTYKKPQRFTGEPALMMNVVKAIAKIKGRSHSEIEQILYLNATNIFLK